MNGLLPPGLSGVDEAHRRRELVASGVRRDEYSTDEAR